MATMLKERLVHDLENDDEEEEEDIGKSIPTPFEMPKEMSREDTHPLKNGHGLANEKVCYAFYDVYRWFMIV